MSDNTNDKNIYDDIEKTVSDEINEEISDESEAASESVSSADETPDEENQPVEDDDENIPDFLSGYEFSEDEEANAPKLYDNSDKDEGAEEETDAQSTRKISNVVTLPARNEKKYHKSFVKKIILRINDAVTELKNAEPKRRMKIISLYSSVVLILILILTDIIPILPNAFNRFYVGNSYVIGETQGGIYDKLGKNIIYVGNGSVMTFGPDMSCKFKKDTIVGVPKLETAGDNALIHYKDSNEAIVISNNSGFKKLEMTEEITGAAISKSGYYGFVTKEAGYKSCVNIYAPGGKSIYKWHTNNPVIDISVSTSGKNMVAASYTYESNAMSGNEPVKEVVTGSNVFSEVRFINDDVVVAFGDMYTAAYTYKGVMKWRVDYGGRTLKSYDFTDDGYIAFIFDRYTSEMSESTVEIYNSSGRLKGKFESKNNVKYVSANNGRFLLSLDRHTILLNSRGDVMKKRKTEKDFRKAVLYHNYNFAFSISDSVAEILSVNH